MREVDTRTNWILDKRRAARWIFSGALALGLALFIAVLTRTRWLPVLGEFLIVDEGPQTADAIVVVSQGLDDRPIYASKLFAAGYAPIVITLGGVTPQSGAASTGAARDAEILQNWGVPPDHIIVLDDTVNLYEDAVRSRDALVARSAQSALVVSGPIRMRRVVIVFGSVYGESGLTYRETRDCRRFTSYALPEPHFSERQ